MSDALNAPQMPAERSSATVVGNRAVHSKNGLMELPEGKLGGWKSGSRDFSSLREGVADSIRLFHEVNDRAYIHASDVVDLTVVVERESKHSRAAIMISGEFSKTRPSKFSKTVVREFDPRRGYAVARTRTHYNAGRHHFTSAAFMSSGLGVRMASSISNAPRAFAHMGLKTADAFFRMHSPEAADVYCKTDIVGTTACSLTANPHIIAMVAKHQIPWFSIYDDPNSRQYGQIPDDHKVIGTIYIPSLYAIRHTDPLAERLAKFFTDTALYTTVPELQESDVDRLATTVLVKSMNARGGNRTMYCRHPFSINTRVGPKDVDKEPSVTTERAVRFLVEHNLPFEVAAGTGFLNSTTYSEPTKPHLQLNLTNEEDYALFLVACPYD